MNKMMWWRQRYVRKPGLCAQEREKTGQETKKKEGSKYLQGFKIPPLLLEEAG
jgi:hypothetical protein